MHLPISLLPYCTADILCSAFENAATILDRFISAPVIPPMYKKNIGLVTLELAFQGPAVFPSGIPTGKPSPRVITLYMILEQSIFQRAAFDDVKQYVDQLSLEEAKYFINNFSRVLLGKVSDPQPQLPESLG